MQQASSHESHEEIPNRQDEADLVRQNSSSSSTATAAVEGEKVGELTARKVEPEITITAASGSSHESADAPASGTAPSRPSATAPRRASSPDLTTTEKPVAGSCVPPRQSSSAAGHAHSNNKTTTGTSRSSSEEKAVQEAGNTEREIGGAENVTQSPIENQT